MWISTWILTTLTLFAVTCNAQTFFWKFGGSFASSELAECQVLPISTILKNGSTPVGPFTLLSIELGGIPVLTPLGNDTNNLNWAVPHKAGSTVMLTVFDSTGNSGGIPNNLFTIIAGTSSSCLPPPPTTPFSVSANVTSTLETCDPWGITITGGTKPYKAIIAALNNFPTTITFQGQQDALTFIDRVPPGLTLIAAIQDATGNWATGTPKVQTAGAVVTPNSCPGLSTLTGSAAAIQAANALSAANTAQAAQAQQRTIIAAIVVSILIILLLAGLAVFIVRRKRRVDQGHIEGQDAKSRPYEAPGTISAPVFTAVTRDSVSSSATHLPEDHECSEKCLCGRYTRLQASIGGGPYSPEGSSLFRQTSTSASSVLRTPTSRNRILPASPRPPGRGPRSLASMSSTKSGPGGSRLTLVDAEADVDVVIQHRDGGVVQELPPPYMLNREGQGSSSGHRTLPPLPPLADVKRPIEEDEEEPAPEFQAGSSSAM